MPHGPAGRRYTQTFPVSGGVSPYTFAVSGALPEGLRWTNAANGMLLDGIPRTIGTFPITLTVTDASGQRVIQQYGLEITPYDDGSSVNLPIAESAAVTDALTIGTVLQISIAEGVSVMDGPSLTLPVVISVTESVGVTDTPSIAPSVWLAVSEPVTTTDVPAVTLPIQVNITEAVAVTDTPVVTPTVFISISESVSVTDIPVVAPTLFIAIAEPITFTDTPATAESVFIAIAEPVSITDTPAVGLEALTITSSATLPTGTLSSAYNFTFTAMGGSSSGYTWSLTSGAQLPKGLRLSSAGLLNGTPTIYGSFTFRVEVTDSQGNVASQPETLVINSTATGTFPQSISRGTIPTVSYANTSFALNATASSGLPVTYVVLSGPATGTNPFSVNGAGTVVIYVEQQGNSQYRAATPLTATIPVAPVVLTVTPADASRVFDGRNPTTDTYTISGFVRNQTSSVVNGAPAGFLTSAVGISPPGAYPLTADVTGLTATNYIFTTGTGTLSVTAGAAQSILFPPPPDIVVGSTLRLAAEATSGLPVTYTISGPATINGNVLTPTGTGTVTVTATQAGNANYQSATSVARSVQVQ